MLVILRELIHAMRRSRTAFSSGRNQAGLLDVGLRRADVHFARYATNIRDDDAGCRTILDVAAKAIVEQTTFAAAWGTMAPPYTLSRPIIGLLENTLTEALA